MSLDRVFRAIADPTRREILRHLRRQSLTAGDIADRFTLSKPSISHHLAQLREADLVFTERVGTSIRYHLNLSVFEELLTDLVELWKGGGRDTPVED
ncbi:MAG: autorepressor SdpR family transcription factor [bacterium]|nr:autorepressor SdpR family transcription factor [bacterium]